MATYATVADLRGYVGSDITLSSNDADLETVLQRAERDIDSLPLPTIGDGTTSGLRYDPLDLSVLYRGTLTRATCAQAEYRIRMGPKFFATDQYEEVSGPDYTIKGKLSRIAPQVRVELRTGGFSVRWARVI